jgi:hypothetical protein
MSTKYLRSDSAMTGFFAHLAESGRERRDAATPATRIEKCMFGHVLGRKRDGTLSDETISAGLHPEGVLVYTERV